MNAGKIITIFAIAVIISVIGYSMFSSSEDLNRAVKVGEKAYIDEKIPGRYVVGKLEEPCDFYPEAGVVEVLEIDVSAKDGDLLLLQFLAYPKFKVKTESGITFNLPAGNCPPGVKLSLKKRTYNRLTTPYKMKEKSREQKLLEKYEKKQEKQERPQEEVRQDSTEKEGKPQEGIKEECVCPKDTQ